MPQEGFLVQAHGKSANFGQICPNLQQYFDNINANFPSLNKINTDIFQQDKEYAIYGKFIDKTIKSQ